MKQIKSILIFLLFAGLASAQDPVSLTGTVLDKDGNPQSGVIAHLKNLGLTDTTGVNGKFSLSNGLTAMKRGNAGFNDASITMQRGSSLDFYNSRAELVFVGVYNINGRLISKIFNGKLGAGAHSIDVMSGIKVENAGFYVVRAQIGSKMNTFSIVGRANGQTAVVSRETSVRALRKGIVAESLPAVEDTLVLSKDNQVIDEMIINNFVDSLPESYIVQRDIYGDFDPMDVNMEGVELVIWGDGISIPKTVEMGFNRQAHAFSGFVYLKHTTVRTDYHVYVNALDLDGRLLGRSVTVDFDERHGDIQVPSFSTMNAYPVVTFTEGLFYPRDTVTLIDSVYDVFEGSVAKIEVDTGAGFMEVNADFSAVLPAGVNSIPFRITDDEGNVVLDTAGITVDAGKPVVVDNFANHSNGSGLISKEDLGDTILIDASYFTITNTGGDDIVSIEWIYAEGMWIFSGGFDPASITGIDWTPGIGETSDFKFTLDADRPVFGEISIFIKVTDGDGNVVFGTGRISQR